VARELWDGVLAYAAVSSCHGGEVFWTGDLLLVCCGFHGWGGRPALCVVEVGDAWAGALACGECGEEGNHG
jgi:hypothetical protein